MSENVIKFRRPEKKPETPEKKPRPPMPGWAPMAGLVVVAVLIYLCQQSGVFA